MTSTIEKEGNLLPHNTTEEWEEIIRLSSLVGTDAKNPEERLIDAIKVKLFNTHNLALQQALEKIEELPINLTGDGYHREEQIKSIITSLQKE